MARSTAPRHPRRVRPRSVVLVLVLVPAAVAACSSPPARQVADRRPRPSVGGGPPSVTARPSRVATAPPAATSDDTLRGVDWCNRGYGATSPTLSACRGTVEQRHRPGEGTWGVVAYELTNVTYGDVTGDGREDAVLVLAVTVRPHLIDQRAPVATGETWVIERRGDELYRYAMELADTVPTQIAIAGTAMTVLWDRDGTRCTQRWQLAGEGQGAVKSARTCSPSRP